MENAHLIGLSRQLALARQMDVVANNVANINTTGFKAEQMLFEEYVMPVAEATTFPDGDQDLSYTQDWATIHDFSGGAIIRTGNELDVALQGEGFLAVSTPGGERFTRAGALQIDNTGRLVTADGHAVLSSGGGEIRFGAEETGVMIDAEGNITTSEGAKGALRIVEFEEPQELAREGNNLFSGGAPRAATETSIIHGAIEGSNVSGVYQIAEMIRVQRAYTSITSMLEKEDELRRSAISTLGRLT